MSRLVNFDSIVIQHSGCQTDIERVIPVTDGDGGARFQAIPAIAQQQQEACTPEKMSRDSGQL